MAEPRYIADSDYGSEMRDRVIIDFEPSKYRTCEEAAKAFHAAMSITVKNYGQDPDSELSILDPETSVKQGYGNYWTVGWEAGPYEWGIVASAWMSGPTWYTEPYYSFNLCFTEK